MLVLTRLNHDLRIHSIVVALVLFFALAISPTAGPARQDKITDITIWTNSGQPMHRFVPTHAFGAAIDGHEKGELDRMLSPNNVREMLSAGLKPLSYRLRTELAGEAWHWNPQGSWSEPQRAQGYWSSREKPGHELISLSYGYRLPHRGNSLDQANDDGYSRVDDGDSKTFWKSNPYLDSHFTGEPNSKLPQWIVLDLGTKQPVNAIRILWAKPYATAYTIEHGGFGGSDDISQALPDVWQAFPKGRIQAGRGGAVTISLSSVPIDTRFVRVLMNESSGNSSRKSHDVRDRLGYAIREISVGTLDAQGRFADVVLHARDNQNQTPVYVSSTDPWHRMQDKDVLIEQPGFDRLFRSRLTNNLPVLIPIPVLYDTPENAAAELRYLKARGYPIARVELGEEPDGQFVMPEDYAALYIQFATALHQVDPKIQLGGPSFQDIEPGDTAGTGKPEWLRRFLTYLKLHGHLDDFTFSSFEWYPFDDVCAPTAPQLANATRLLTGSLEQMRAATEIKRTPWIITEYGYSAFGGRAEMDIEGALLNADIVGSFLILGGEQAFLYGYEPNDVLREVSCSAGNNMLFLMGPQGKIEYRMPTYYGAELLTHEWAMPGDGLHGVYRATANDEFVAAYAVQRPDGLWAVMLINKDPDKSRRVKVKFRNETDGEETGFRGTVDWYQYSRNQYELSSNNKEPYPIRDLSPEHERVNASDLTVDLPAYSLTVVRGSISFDRTSAAAIIESWREKPH